MATTATAQTTLKQVFDGTKEPNFYKGQVINFKCAEHGSKQGLVSIEYKGKKHYALIELHDIKKKHKTRTARIRWYKCNEGKKHIRHIIGGRRLYITGVIDRVDVPKICKCGDPEYVTISIIVKQLR